VPPGVDDPPLPQPARHTTPLTAKIRSKLFIESVPLLDAQEPINRHLEPLNDVEQPDPHLFNVAAAQVFAGLERLDLSGAAATDPLNSLATNGS
jgi:hypothetical protein